MNIKGQDVLVTLKTFVIGKAVPYGVLASELGMSASEVHAATQRAIEAGLADAETRLPRREALAEFLIHGLKYVFPVKRGEITRGIPTMYAVPPLSSMISVDKSELPPVWPDKEGVVRGYSISPLCRSVPVAAQNDSNLYELLALVDSIRGGKARERQLAIKEILLRFNIKRISWTINLEEELR